MCREGVVDGCIQNLAALSPIAEDVWYCHFVLIFDVVSFEARDKILSCDLIYCETNSMMTDMGF